MKVERPILNYVRVLAALEDGPADDLMVEKLGRISKKMASLSKLDLVLGAIASGGFAVCLTPLASGGILGKPAEVYPIIVVLLCAFGLGCVAVANYRWITRMHRQISSALAEEVDMFERLSGGRNSS